MSLKVFGLVSKTFHLSDRIRLQNGRDSL